MSPRIGRPPVENPMNERITVRLDRNSSEILKWYCEKENVDKAEAIRQGIQLLAEKYKPPLLRGKKGECFAHQPKLINIVYQFQLSNSIGVIL